MHTKIVLFACLLAIGSVAQVIHNEKEVEQKRRADMYVYLEDETN